MMRAFTETILKEEFISATPVYGGDINTCYRIQTKDGPYFLKMNDAVKFPGMFEKEAAGLMALRETGAINVPLVLQQGLWQQRQFLLLQWIDSAAISKDFWQSFGHSLAAMHRNTAGFFGWKEDNYIGSLFQTNTQQISWDQFFIENRIKPMLQLLAESGKFSAAEYNNALAFCDGCSNLFPKEPPALLHGDLWSGNFMANKDGQAVLYDPAVYYGHREMDIGMTKLFGGFPSEFYTAYHQRYPLAEGWEQRLPLTQLYPVLVHAVLFGGHYILQAKDMMLQYG